MLKFELLEDNALKDTIIGGIAASIGSPTYTLGTVAVTQVRKPVDSHVKAFEHWCKQLFSFLNFKL